jgi:6-phosphogluconate dehydrogenase
MIGLGRMGGNMVKRLIKAGHDIAAFNRTAEKTKALEKDGVTGTYSLTEFIQKLQQPRIVWLMLPAGDVTEKFVNDVVKLLSKGDIIVEGGNSPYRDDIRRFEELKKTGIHYVDAGVSGGIWGLKVGYCTMVGGEQEIFKHMEPILRDLAPKDGYMYCGGPGAGHFVKMIHNAIEYGLMEAYAEGFEILKASPYTGKLDLQQVAHLWNQGSVVRSWLLELLENVFDKDSGLDEIQGFVEDSGEARWTVKEAIDTGVPADVITTALYKRFNSRQKDAFANRVLAALRREFGGHAVARQGEDVKTSDAGAGRVKHAAADKKPE